ncbi:MAG: T9SS type A sorting domain-containing protein [Bacteroidetes bacterium]|nr:T9SS type A sorting domain-containing protein [Bacteroidota bacterium]
MNLKHFYLLFLFPLTVSAQDIYFSDPIPVADNSYGSRAPRVDLLDDGSPVVYFGKSGTNPLLHIARFSGDAFLTPVQIPISNLDVNLWSGELGPQLATFGNTVYVVYEVYGEGIYLSTSTDGGDNWLDPISVVDLPAGRFATLPSVGVDPAGNPVVSFVTTNSFEQEAQYEVAISTNGGVSFEPTVVANAPASGEEVCECCPASIGTDSDGQLFLTFRNNNNNIRDIWVSRAPGVMADFDTATDIDDTDWEIFSCPASGPNSVQSNDDWVSVFFSAGAGFSSVYVSELDRNTMTAGGQWAMPTFNGGETTQNYPRIAGQGDTLAMVWEESATGSKDVLFAWSDSGASNLIDASYILAGGDFAQRNPDIAYRDGLFHVVYTDQLTNQVMYVEAGFAPFVSVKEPKKEVVSFGLSPNPASGNFDIRLAHALDQTARYRVLELSGKVVASGYVSQEVTAVSCTHLPEGIYFVEVIFDEAVSGANRMTEKLVLQRK